MAKKTSKKQEGFPNDAYRSNEFLAESRRLGIKVPQEFFTEGTRGLDNVKDTALFEPSSQAKKGKASTESVDLRKPPLLTGK